MLLSHGWAPDSAFLSALVSLLLHFSVVQFRWVYAYCTNLWKWCCGNGNILIKTNCLPVSQLVSFPLLSQASSFLTVDRISHPRFLSAVSMTLSSTLSGTFPTHSFVAGFCLFWSCKMNRFWGSSDTRSCILAEVCPWLLAYEGRFSTVLVCVEPLLLVFSAAWHISSDWQRWQRSFSYKHQFTLLAVSVRDVAGNCGTHWAAHSPRYSKSYESVDGLHIYHSARIILELRQGCGYDIGAYQKSFYPSSIHLAVDRTCAPCACFISWSSRSHFSWNVFLCSSPFWGSVAKLFSDSCTSCSSAFDVPYF